VGPRGGGAHADENPSQFTTPHNIGIDRQNNVYVADRNNRRIQVFDREARLQRFIRLNAARDREKAWRQGECRDACHHVAALKRKTAAATAQVHRPFASPSAAAVIDVLNPPRERK